MGCKSQLIMLLLFLLAVFKVTEARATKQGIVVAKDGSGDFKTVQDAVNSVRDFSEQKVVIYIKPGVYKEKLVIPSWKVNIKLLGAGKDSTTITYNDYSGANGIITFTSYTVLVQGNGFSAEALTIENTAGSVGQAVALHVEADRVFILNCHIKGNQDTLYPSSENSRQYYLNCEIEGTTDFIFGAATAVFENCLIRSKRNSYITAASTGDKQKYGFVFLNCTLIADEAVSRVYLGRPWRSHAKTVFINTNMGKHIVPAGWRTWNDNNNHLKSFYAEYRSYGPGGDSSQRVDWSNQLDKKMLKAYTIENIFSTINGWNPVADK
ncbi:pectinesterase family protein [Pedobacter immunditicola]|uniref:pectinesterase family protein n=1 Tax=Pedobacter immunditicola TaxID=3133440 RepID=UPI0030A21009